jgi:acyl-coenzyme A thioesterase PaaI-like protein
MSESFQTKLFKNLMNWHPVYRHTGGKITYIAADWREVRISLPLNYNTRNYVGTIFGGSIYAAIDPIYMLQLIKILGKDYVVWDKAAQIRFIRPGRETLFATLRIEEETLQHIRQSISTETPSLEISLPIQWLDKNGKVHAAIDKTLYIADKQYYEQKKKHKT